MSNGASSSSRAAGKTVAIVGGVAGGASAAARLRRNCEEVAINLYERGPYVSFANCGLPYYVGGIIKEQSKLFLTNPKNLKERYNISTFVNHEVVSIDPDNGTLVVRNTETGEERTDTYDEIVLSPGAAPIVPPFPGRDLPGIFTIRNVPDTERVKEWLKTHPNTKHVCVVGGGFIGIEMAENLRHLGYGVTLIDVADQVMTPMDKEMTEWCERILRENDIKIQLGDGVASFEKNGEGLRVTTSKGSQIDADMVIMSIGVRAESELAKAAGLKLTKSGCIEVDDCMRTSHPKVYAVGDAVEKRNTLLDIDMPFYMAGPANRQGRIVADVIAGIDHKFRGIQGTGIVGAFGLQVAMTGAAEKHLVRAGKVRGKDYEVIYLHPNDHVGYYPGAQAIHMKVVFTVPDGKILGAQAVSLNGADRRIDVLSMAMQMGATVYDIAEAELCYAPQFGAAKDPVNLAGMYAVNVLRGYSTIAHWDRLPERPDVYLLDCREKGEFNNGSAPNAVNIPLSEIRIRLDEVPKDREVWVFCQSGVRAHTCTRMLLQEGFNVKNISGGFISFQNTPELHTTAA